MSIAPGYEHNQSIDKAKEDRTGGTRFVVRLGLAIGVLGILGGCSAPGMKMDLRTNRSESSTLIGGLQVTLHSISPELVASQAPRGLGSINWDGLLVAKPQPYRIGPQDILLPAVWEHPEISMPMGPNRVDNSSGSVVDEDGYIFFPYVGRYKVSGLTLAQAREGLAVELGKVLRNPQVDLKVLAYRSQKVYVGGEVRIPAVYTVTDVPFTLAEAVNRAGGFTSTADDSRIILTRGNRSWRLNFPALLGLGGSAGQIILQDGDALQIPNVADDPIYVMGEVGRPGNVPLLHGNLSLARALSDAGGIQTLSADATSIYVIRAGSAANTVNVYHLDGRNPSSMVMADKFAMNAHDIVYVDAGSLVRFSRVMNLILPSITTATQVGIDAAEIKYLKSHP